MREGRRDIQSRNVQNAHAVLEEVISDAPALEACQLKGATKAGACLTMLPFMLNGKEFGDQEWRDDLLLCYDIDLLDPPTQCDRFNTAFSIRVFL